ncbi:hypothetical protein HY493_00030 [Candidatus Woesearchaeota archaeon]|nr:hypothetical protein [Candidatus Woesearchaeota archaeon]
MTYVMFLFTMFVLGTLTLGSPETRMETEGFLKANALPFAVLLASGIIVYAIVKSLLSK